MSAGNRQQQILDLIMEQGSVQVDDLAETFTVSRMTIHRDLDALVQEGVIRKVRGGATIESSSWFESDYRYRAKLAVQEKKAIAAVAASLIEPGQVLIIDDGTTAAGMVAHVQDQMPLTVITNNLAAITDLHTVGGIELITLGGNYDRRFHGFFGLVAEQSMGSLRADLLFMSTSSVKGLTAYHQDQEVVKTKRAMLAAADRSILLIDHRKFGRTALHVLCDLTEFQMIVTCASLPKSVIDEVRDAGVEVLLADADPDWEMSMT